MSENRTETGLAPADDFPEDFPEEDFLEEDFPEEPYDNFDGDTMLQDEMGPDAQEDEFGMMLVELANGICSQKPAEQQEMCYANFESLQGNISGVALGLGISLEDTKTALALCAPCLTKEGKEDICPLQPLLETYENKTTCGEFIAQLFPDLN